MPEISGDLVKRPIDAALNTAYRKVVYPVSKWGYEQIQQRIGTGIREEGLTLPQSVDRVYDRMGARIKLLPEDSHTVDTLRHGKGIFVGNNQDPCTFFTYFRALTERPSNDVYFVEKATNMPFWDESIRDHILPVYLGKQFDYKRSYITEKTRESPDYERIEGLSASERQRLNSQSLSTAATRVADGGIVIIFPSGAGSTDEWKRGTGELVHNLGDRNSDAQLIMGYTQGTSKWDKYRLAPGIRRVRPINVTMHIKAVNLGEILAGVSEDADDKKISRHLQRVYDDWVALKKADEKRTTVNSRHLQ